MDTLERILPIVWFGIIALFLSIYLITDGFDLGVGILTLRRNNEEEKGILMNTLSSVWDANETWLVCTGGALF
ncbi:MAG: cytochrome d ubiquinol oxidase subunit II, partial [Dolichospermum sp.]